jgi:hypothetical protein
MYSTKSLRLRVETTVRLLLGVRLVSLTFRASLILVSSVVSRKTLNTTTSLIVSRFFSRARAREGGVKRGRVPPALHFSNRRCDTQGISPVYPLALDKTQATVVRRFNGACCRVLVF